MINILGRSEELRQIRQHIEWVAKPHKDDEPLNRLVILYGEPGVGKTRMIQEVYKNAWDIFSKIPEKSNKGLNYRRELKATGTGYLNLEINPTLDPDSARSDFIWIGARYDNPEYRQFRNYSLVDSIAAWLGQRGIKNNAIDFDINDSLEGGGTILGSLKNMLEIAGDISEAVPIISQGIKAGKTLYTITKDQIPSYNAQQEALKERINETYKIINKIRSPSGLPTILAIDNLHWIDSGENGSANDHLLIKKLLEREDTKWGRFNNIGEAPKKLLLIATVNSLTYKRIEARLHHEEGCGLLLKTIFDLKTSTHDAVGITRLNESDSREMARQLLATTSKTKDDHAVNDICEWALGYPLRISEACNVFDKVPNFLNWAKSAPSDSKIIAYDLLKHVYSESNIDMACTAYVASLIASDSGTFSEYVLSHVIGHKRMSRVGFSKIEKLVDSGLFQRSLDDSGILAFSFNELPNEIRTSFPLLERVRNNYLLSALRKNSTKVLSDLLSPSPEPYDSQIDTGSLVELKFADELQLDDTVQLELRCAVAALYKEQSHEEIKNLSLSEFAKWVDSIAEQCLGMARNGQFKAANDIWMERTENLIDHLMWVDDNRFYLGTDGREKTRAIPRPNHAHEICESWQIACWIKLLQIGMLVMTNPQIDKRLRLGEHLTLDSKRWQGLSNAFQIWNWASKSCPASWKQRLDLIYAATVACFILDSQATIAQKDSTNYMYANETIFLRQNLPSYELSNLDRIKESYSGKSLTEFHELPFGIQAILIFALAPQSDFRNNWRSKIEKLIRIIYPSSRFPPIFQ